MRIILYYLYWSDFDLVRPYINWPCSGFSLFYDDIRKDRSLLVLNRSWVPSVRTPKCIFYCVCILFIIFCIHLMRIFIVLHFLVDSFHIHLYNSYVVIILSFCQFSFDKFLSSPFHVLVYRYPPRELKSWSVKPGLLRNNTPRQDT